jgi:uncharacterized membrane protein
MDDPAQLDRQTAYLEHVRSLGRPARFAGFVACALGVAMMVLARYRLGGAPWVLWSGVAVIALGWGLFIYALARRLTWVRAHPFDSNPPSGSKG